MGPFSLMESQCGTTRKDERNLSISHLISEILTLEVGTVVRTAPVVNTLAGGARSKLTVSGRRKKSQPAYYTQTIYQVAFQVSTFGSQDISQSTILLKGRKANQQ